MWPACVLGFLHRAARRHDVFFSAGARYDRPRHFAGELSYEYLFAGWFTHFPAAAAGDANDGANDNLDAIRHAIANQYQYANTNVDTDGDRQRSRDRHAVANRYGNGHCAGDRNGDSDADRNGACHGDGDANTDGRCEHGDADDPGDSNANGRFFQHTHADTAAPADGGADQPANGNGRSDGHSHAAPALSSAK